LKRCAPAKFFDAFVFWNVARAFLPSGRRRKTPENGFICLDFLISGPTFLTEWPVCCLPERGFVHFFLVLKGLQDSDQGNLIGGARTGFEAFSTEHPANGRRSMIGWAGAYVSGEKWRTRGVQWLQEPQALMRSPGGFSV